MGVCMPSMLNLKGEVTMQCILCGTDIENNFCYECDSQASDMGYDYDALIGCI